MLYFEALLLREYYLLLENMWKYEKHFIYFVQSQNKLDMLNVWWLLDVD